MSKRKTSDVSDALELVGGGAKGEFAIEKPEPKERKHKGKRTVSDDQAMSTNGILVTQFHPLAIKFDISDAELQLVDAIKADPYHNATQAYMLQHPACSSMNAAYVNISRILAKPNIRAYQKWCVENAHTAQIVTREFVLLRLRHVADRAMGATPVFDKDGQPTGEYKCDFNAANKALELLGKHQGMFKEESRIRIKHDRPIIKITVPGREDRTDGPVPRDNVQSPDEEE